MSLRYSRGSESALPRESYYSGLLVVERPCWRGRWLLRARRTSSLSKVLSSSANGLGNLKRQYGKSFGREEPPRRASYSSTNSTRLFRDEEPALAIAESQSES